jgi:hypothetical protein
MTTPIGPLSPYVTPAILQAAPTGISWASIPSGSQTTPEARAAEILNICNRATSMAEGYANQVLRAAFDTEFVQGPDYYATLQPSTGNIRVILQRWPIMNILAVSVSPNTFPRSFVSLPAGFWAADVPVLGVYGSTAAGGSAQGGQAIIISGQAGGGWDLGRKGYVIQVQYVSGWPHASLTAAANVGDNVLQVDDCTGWAVTNDIGITGARGTLYDPGGNQEQLTASASSVTAGPGTLTLSTPVLYAHPVSTLFTTMPATIQWACVLYSASIALTRGATATSVHTIPGGGAGTPALRGPESLLEEAELLLHSYKRVI